MKAIYSAFVFTFAFIPVLLFGDTVLLKSGEKVEGKITSSSADEVSIEVKVSPTIRDERIIERADIAKIDAMTPDEVAFYKIKDLHPADTVLKPDYYDVAIQNKIQPFLTQFAYSSYVPEVRKIGAVFDAEKARMIKTEEIKFEGDWLKKGDYEKNRYEIDAQALLDQMEEASAKGEYPKVLNLYDRMKKNFPKSASYPAAVSSAWSNINKLNKTISAFLVQLNANEKTREEKLQISTVTEQEQVRQAIAREKAAINAAVETSKKNGLRFISLYPNNRDALVALQESVHTAATEINAIPLSAMARSVQLTREAQKALNIFDLTVAENDLTEARQLWPENDLIPTIDGRLKDRKAQLEKSNKAQKDSVQRAAK
ncbi:MAG: PTPDL family protein [Chthoniobacterales bacterium]